MKALKIWVKYIWAYLSFGKILLVAKETRQGGKVFTYYNISPIAVRHFWIDFTGVSFLASFSGYVEKVFIKLDDVEDITFVRGDE